MFDDLRLRSSLMTGGEKVALILLPLLLVGVVALFVVGSGNAADTIRAESRQMCSKVIPALGTGNEPEVAAAQNKKLSPKNSASKPLLVLADINKTAEQKSDARKELRFTCNNYSDRATKN